MIGYEDLKELLTSYGIDYTKVIMKNDNVIDYGEYREIKRVLDYLIGKLNISPKNIEKCPSILYFNVGAIKGNYEFLKSTPITISNINNCLHILSADPIELRKTYEYVLNNYGISVLNRQTSILNKTIDYIKKYEYKFKDIMSNEALLSAIISRKDINEIEKIVHVCKKYNIEITGNVFHKTAAEIEKIVLVCQSHNIGITGSVFHKIAEKIERIVHVCQKYNIKITGSIFLKTADEIEDSCNYIESKYGDVYLKSLIVNKNKKYLEKVLPYLEELGVLPIVINSASILTLKLEEIIERKSVLDKLGEPMVKNNKFNSIFGLSRKNYQKKLKELNIELDDIKGRKV